MTPETGQNDINDIPTQAERESKKECRAIAKHLQKHEVVSRQNKDGDLIQVVMTTPYLFYIQVTLQGDEKPTRIMEQHFTPERPIEKRCLDMANMFQTMLLLAPSELRAYIFRLSSMRKIEEQPTE